MMARESRGDAEWCTPTSISIGLVRRLVHRVPHNATPLCVRARRRKSIGHLCARRTKTLVMSSYTNPHTHRHTHTISRILTLTRVRNTQCVCSSLVASQSRRRSAAAAATRSVYFNLRDGTRSTYLPATRAKLLLLLCWCCAEMCLCCVYVWGLWCSGVLPIGNRVAVNTHARARPYIVKLALSVCWIRLFREGDPRRVALHRLYDIFNCIYIVYILYIYGRLRLYRVASNGQLAFYRSAHALLWPYVRMKCAINTNCVCFLGCVI